MAYSVPLGYFDEGEQAENYLRAKQNRVSKLNNDEYNRHIHRSYKAGDAGMEARITSGNKTIEIDPKSIVKSNLDHNPRLKTAKQIHDHRKIYGDIMPKSKSKEELEVEKRIDKERRANEYAANIVNRHIAKHDLNKDGDKYNPTTYSDAFYSAKRKYNESFIFESVEFI